MRDGPQRDGSRMRSRRAGRHHQLPPVTTAAAADANLSRPAAGASNQDGHRHQERDTAGRERPARRRMPAPDPAHRGANTGERHRGISPMAIRSWGWNTLPTHDQTGGRHARTMTVKGSHLRRPRLHAAEQSDRSAHERDPGDVAEPEGRNQRLLNGWTSGTWLGARCAAVAKFPRGRERIGAPRWVRALPTPRPAGDRRGVGMHPSLARLPPLGAPQGQTRKAHATSPCEIAQIEYAD